MSHLLKLESINCIKSGTKIIDDFNLVQKKGENIFLLGPNGCGKTTTIAMILGLIKH